MGIPSSVVDTGKNLFGMRTFTDALIPNCSHCYVMSGHHEKTKEIGFYAFCIRSRKLEHVGPYKSYHEALKSLVLTKGCDVCSINKSELKEAYLPVLDEQIKVEIESLYGIGQTPAIIMSPLQDFTESRNYLNTNFKSRFGINLFLSLTDDAVAIKDLAKPCVNQADFALKIQALAGLIDRINGKELKEKIKEEKKQNLKGSITILEQFLKENYPNYPKYIISNLRNLLSLRSKIYPTHATDSEIIMILGNLGIGKYPLNNWEEGVSKILHLCSKSLSSLLILLQNEEKVSRNRNKIPP
jgi:hypothetical protein